MSRRQPSPSLVVVAVLGLASLVACPASDTTTTPADPDGPAAAAPPSAAWKEARATAAAGVDDPELAALLTEHWEARLTEYPESATRLGVRDFDARLTDHTPEARTRRKQATRAWLERGQAIDAGSLSAADRETLELFVADLQTAVALEVCRADEWNIGVQNNPVSAIVKLHEGFGLATPADGGHLVARYRAAGALVDQRIALLRRGAADGLFASRQSLERLLALVDRQLAEPTDRWAMLAPVVERVPAAWPADARAAFAEALREAVHRDVQPAVQRYRDYLAEAQVPQGRDAASPGVGHMPSGAECYAAQIRNHTTLGLSAAEVHQIGLEEIARIDAEIAALGARALGTASLSETLARLRDDRSLYFATADEVKAAAESSLAAAKAAMPASFGILPKADCVVRVVPAFEAPQTHIGYYEPPFADGAKPGEYFVNVHAPSTRPRFEARVLAVHEAIPGHHLQTAIAQELPALPAFRRHGGYGAYVEGWALYTERLADEMGLYPTDLDRMGMLSFDAWRAGRLVVDTGIHAMGWTRAQAEAFLTEHTALTPTNIANEVDRYIGWPGQALGYKLGQRHIWALRRKVEAAQGERFSLPAFHDVVLAGGPVTLDVLTRRVDAWLAAGG